MTGILSSIQSWRRSFLSLVGERVKRRLKYLEINENYQKVLKELFFQLKNTDRRNTRKVLGGTMEGWEV